MPVSGIGILSVLAAGLMLVGLFGRDHVYVELQRHFLRDQEADNQALTAQPPKKAASVTRRPSRSTSKAAAP